jgi:hypothetical protein
MKKHKNTIINACYFLLFADNFIEFDSNHGNCGPGPIPYIRNNHKFRFPSSNLKMLVKEKNQNGWIKI